MTEQEHLEEETKTFCSVPTHLYIKKNMLFGVPAINRNPFGGGLTKV